MAQSAEELEAQKEIAEQEMEEQVQAAGDEAEAEARVEGVAEEEVQRRVEAARKEEKDKLYPKIEELSNLVKEQQEYIREQKDKQAAEEEKAAAAAEKRRLAKLSEEERETEARHRLEEQLKEEREARIALESRIAEKERANQLEEYRQGALRAAGERIIPELVVGNSEEEIDAAVQTAKAKYEEIENQLREERGQQVREQLSQSTSPDTEALAEEELEKRLSAVDQDKYLKDPEYREKIKDQLEAAYQRAMGR